MNMKFNILAKSSKVKQLQTISQNIKYKLTKTVIKMSFIAHVYSLLMNTYLGPNQSFKPFRYLET